MPFYKYKAINVKNARIISGTMLANNVGDLKQKLATIDNELMSATTAGASGMFSFGGIKTKEIMQLFIYVEKLSNVGITPVEALSTFISSISNKAFKSILISMEQDMRGGMMFSDALRKYPLIFTTIMTGIIEAGERSGNLSDALHELVDYVEWHMGVKAKLIGATIYPAFMLIAISASTTIMIVKVVPKILSFLSDEKIALPIYTKALLAFSHFAGSYWYVLIAAIFILIFLRIMLYRYVRGFRYNYDKMKLHIPIVKDVVVKTNMANFFNLFTMCYKNGIEILESIATARDVISNSVIKESIFDVEMAINKGMLLSDAFSFVPNMPQFVLQMLRIGEEAGALVETLSKVTTLYNQDVQSVINKAIASIKPAMTVIIGVMISWLVLGVFGPMYGSIGTMMKKM